VSGREIQAVGIVVPARDEQDRITDCLLAVRAAVAALPPSVAVAGCVVADRCRDATAPVARQAWGRQPGLEVLVNAGELTIGQVRDRGVRALLRRLPATLERTWLLHTDADTVVPPGWVADHLRYAEAGADAVAGAIDLDDPRSLPADTLCRYADLVEAGTGRYRHRHAYAANLGVRAAAYAAVGGFPAVASGEEHALLALLRKRGHSVVSPTDVRARTSARLHGRARDGLADLLRGLTEEAEPVGSGR
jgi:Glycosyltransferase like family 2